MLANVEVIAATAGVKDAFGAFRGMPAVVCATGPSLGAALPRLARLRDHALVIAVDASLAPMLAAGVRPHLVTCLERVAETAPFFRGLDPAAVADTWQVAVPVVVPEVYRAYPGPQALMYRTFAHFDLLDNDKGTLGCGTSSANMAFKLAEAFGCDPILLVGQDLCYGPDAQSHAHGAHVTGAALAQRPAPARRATRGCAGRCRGSRADARAGPSAAR